MVKRGRRHQAKDGEVIKWCSGSSPPPKMSSGLLILDFSDISKEIKFETTWHIPVTPLATLLGGWALLTTQRVSMTLPATLLGGWAPHIDSACLRNSTSNPIRGLGAA
jgi:hypothetical protein